MAEPPSEMTRIVRDYYELLGVPRDASAEEIHRAFRVSARRWHPDVNTHPDAGERFHELSTAYEVLHDPLERARYDRATTPGRNSSLRRRTHPAFTAPPPAARRTRPEFIAEPPAARRTHPDFAAEPPAAVLRFRDERETLALGPIVIRLGAVVRWLS